MTCSTAEMLQMVVSAVAVAAMFYWLVGVVLRVLSLLETRVRDQFDKGLESRRTMLERIYLDVTSRVMLFDAIAAARAFFRTVRWLLPVALLVGAGWMVVGPCRGNV